MQIKPKTLAALAAPLALSVITMSPALADDTRPIKDGWGWTSSNGVSVGSCSNDYEKVPSGVPDEGTYIIDYADGHTNHKATKDEADYAIEHLDIVKNADARSIRYNFDAGYERVENKQRNLGTVYEDDCVRPDYVPSGNGKNTGDDGHEDFKPKPEKPKPYSTIDITEFKDAGEPNCETAKVPQSQTVTRTEHDFTWDENTWKWIDKTTSTETHDQKDERSLTDEEVEKCQPKPTPGDTDETTKPDEPEKPTTPETPKHDEGQPSDGGGESNTPGGDKSEPEKPTTDKPKTDQPKHDEPKASDGGGDTTIPAPPVKVQPTPAPSEKAQPVESATQSPKASTSTSPQSEKATQKPVKAAQKPENGQSEPKPTQSQAAPAAATQTSEGTSLHRLPRTGIEAKAIGITSAALLALGGLAYVVARRYNKSQH